GCVIARRQVLALAAATLALLPGPRSRAAELKGDVPRGCVVTPEQIEGPYYVESRLHRSDIRTDPLDGERRPGAPLALALRVLTVARGLCTPLAGAMVDVWHCDAAGFYSDVRDPRFDTTGKRFLRGYQLTDADGWARFRTIYPGWYPGRAVHIHFKVRVKGEQRGFGFPSQLYFDDALTDRVHAQPPYSARSGQRTRNAEDGLYRRGGRQLMLAVKETPDGLAGAFDV